MVSGCCTPQLLDDEMFPRVNDCCELIFHGNSSLYMNYFFEFYGKTIRRFFVDKDKASIRLAVTRRFCIALQY